jgi:hypothetical protein
MSTCDGTDKHADIIGLAPTALDILAGGRLAGACGDMTGAVSNGAVDGDAGGARVPPPVVLVVVVV